MKIAIFFKKRYRYRFSQMTIAIFLQAPKARPYSFFNLLTMIRNMFTAHIKMRVPEKLSRKSLGVQLFLFLKIRLKLEILLKPQ
jgi:hypothetical protein